MFMFNPLFNRDRFVLKLTKAWATPDFKGATIQGDLSKQPARTTPFTGEKNTFFHCTTVKCIFLAIKMALQLWSSVEAAASLEL